MSMLHAMVPIARRAITDPREAAETLLSLGVPKEAYWPGLVFVVVCSTLFSGIGEMIAPTMLAQVPLLALAALMFVMFAMFTMAVWRIGVAMGGKGAFDEALLMTVFVQGMIVAAQAVQLLLLFVLPPFAALFSVAVSIIGIWININFIDALHGYRSLGRSAGVFFLSTLAVAFALMILSGLLGFRVGVTA